ncbi:MAG TPA: hypothetical protein EYG40_09390 [Verrucomicrobia bacterium]|nr:hypothetical protein [Verrucomicrobiales bacterium]HIL55236.1 hypothetical protein [Verrucomicrobiota bacterium]
MQIPYINRELSWLEFNHRVLNEAAVMELPVLERLKFLAITVSNLDDFFLWSKWGDWKCCAQRGRENRTLPALLIN